MYEAINKLRNYRIIYANFIHEYGVNFHELYFQLITVGNSFRHEWGNHCLSVYTFQGSGSGLKQYYTPKRNGAEGGMQN